MSIHVMRSDLNLPYHMTAIRTTCWQTLQSAWDTYVHITYIRTPSGLYTKWESNAWPFILVSQCMWATLLTCSHIWQWVCGEGKSKNWTESTKSAKLHMYWPLWNWPTHAWMYVYIHCGGLLCEHSLYKKWFHLSAYITYHMTAIRKRRWLCLIEMYTHIIYMHQVDYQVGKQYLTYFVLVTNSMDVWHLWLQSWTNATNDANLVKWLPPFVLKECEQNSLVQWHW